MRVSNHAIGDGCGTFDLPTSGDVCPHLVTMVAFLLPSPLLSSATCRLDEERDRMWSRVCTQVHSPFQSLAPAQMPPDVLVPDVLCSPCVEHEGQAGAFTLEVHGLDEKLDALRIVHSPCCPVPTILQALSSSTSCSHVLKESAGIFPSLWKRRHSRLLNNQSSFDMIIRRSMVPLESRT